MVVDFDPAKIEDSFPTNSSMKENGFVQIRKFLIKSAINFLANPRLKSSTRDVKKQFLLNKGLTPDEIDLAFELSMAKSLNGAIESDLIGRADQTYGWKILVTLYRLLLCSGFCYGAFRLYQVKIRPLLFNDDKIAHQPSAQELICDQLRQLNEQIVELSRNIAIVHEFISTYCQLRDDTVGKMKNELISIKALLVNRNQFPPIPTIPKWQLNGAQNNPVKSLEIINDDNGDDDTGDDPGSI